MSRRAGKKFFIDVSYSEDEDGVQRRHIKPRWDWRIPETAVMQQEEGQAFWSYKARAQHVMTAPVPISPEQVMEAWRDIRRLEAIQRQLLEVEARRREAEAAQKQQHANTDQKQQSATSGTQQTPRPGTRNMKRHNSKSAHSSKAQLHTASSEMPQTPGPAALQLSPPASNVDDDEPDRL